MKENSKFLIVGKIVGAHGVRGEVKVLSYTAEPKNLPTLSGLTDDKGRPFKVKMRGIIKDAVILAIEGVTDRNMAETLKGTMLQVPRDSLPELPVDADEFYLEDLVGLEVRSAGQAYGRVVSVQNFGASDIVEISREGQRQTEMFAFTEANFPEMDIASGFLVLNVPEEV